MKSKTFRFFPSFFYMKDEIGHSLSAIKCPPGCFFYYYYSPLNQQFSCLFISESQWPLVMLFTSPVLGGSWPHFLPSGRRTLVLLWFFFSNMHRYVSKLPCDLPPQARGACWLRHQWMNIFWDEFAAFSTPKGKNHRKSCVSPKKGWTVVLEAGQSEAKYRMWSCLSVTSLHHFSLALPPPQSRPHQFFARLLAPHKHPTIHIVMNRVLPWTSLSKSLPPFPILPSLNQTVSPKRESTCCTDTEKDDQLGEKGGSFVLLFSFLSLGSQCWTGEA